MVMLGMYGPWSPEMILYIQFDKESVWFIFMFSFQIFDFHS